jgi:hypothetical protein
MTDFEADLKAVFDFYGHTEAEQVQVRELIAQEGETAREWYRRCASLIRWMNEPTWREGSGYVAA